jgi:hypothetical protein
MARNQIAVSGSINKTMSVDEFADALSAALQDGGELHDFQRLGDGSILLKASPKQGNYGIKASVRSVQNSDGTSSVNLEGKYVVTRWFWPIIHGVLFLCFLPWGIAMILSSAKSRKLVLQYADDLMRKLRLHA